MNPALVNVINKVLDTEGGIADVHDGKGVTYFGQTVDWLTQHGLEKPSNRDQAFANYALWMSRLRLDAICAIDAYVGWVTTDGCIHHGDVVGVKLLQRSLGVKDDGIIGPKTLKRCEDVATLKPFQRRLLAVRGRYYGEVLGSESVDRRKFARNFLGRFGAFIEALP